MKKVISGFRRFLSSFSMVPTALLGCLISSGSTAGINLLEIPETWVSLRGIVVDQQSDGLILDYGQGTIIIEMDDWDNYDESKMAFEGDIVTVHGKIEGNFYLDKSIKAESLYFQNLNLAITDPSSTDEESYNPFGHYTLPMEYDLQVNGKVTSTKGREFTIDNGLEKITVDTALMPYNPMDDRGFQKIHKGDYVSVVGELDIDFFEEREIKAKGIVSLL